MRNHKRGFTLIEMLATIAIIALLVAIIVPAVANSLDQGKAASDAANLRTVLSMLNIDVLNGEKTIQEVIDSSPNPRSVMDPDAVLTVVFETPGFIDAFYVNGDVYYGLDYLSEVATYGTSSLSTERPEIPGGIWYSVDP